MKVARMLVGAWLAVSLAGCGIINQDGISKQDAGGLLGAIGGAAIGSQFGRGGGSVAMAAIGVVLGAILGSEVGASLDRADLAYLRQAEQRAYAAPIGQSIVWNNPESGHSGVIIPTRDGRSQQGNYCREFQQQIKIGGKTEQGYGVACRQPDGSWMIVSRR